jgi:hypothetical protein
MKIEVSPLGYEAEREKMVAQLNAWNAAYDEISPVTAADVDSAVQVWLTKEVENILNNLRYHLKGYHFEMSNRGFYDALDATCEPSHDEDDGLSDVEADADTLRMAGWGTDEDYFSFEREDF